MRAMILAAGLGTRLKPWTLSHPKALVPVQGVPMLERVILKLKSQGFNFIVVNIHHFGSQIIDFLESHDFGMEIRISDERERLLDTGGAILHAYPLFGGGDEPILIHNVDILSDANLAKLVESNIESGADSTLLVSERESTRKLIFSPDMDLRGWHSETTGAYKPEGFIKHDDDLEYAFSGIHVLRPDMIREMGRIEKDSKFAIMDFLLSSENRCRIKGYLQPELKLIDIGKPATLSQANTLRDN
ncbi:MAG: NTP transferase domain-containing protein [Muribaculaceae bacterium]|nr:NTP transferase domain-containing protein [Muribaculaceae bacterium]MDE6753450.1 NTP transferase domain-containing protein [Muribaculaceae bacterium]